MERPTLRICLAALAMVAACHQDNKPAASGPTPVVTPESAPSVAISASAPPAPHIDEPFPSPLPGAVWTAIRWNMHPKDVVDALASMGIAAKYEKWSKTAGGRIELEHRGWQGTVYFSSSDTVSQILLLAEKTNEAVTTSARARLESRFGQPTTQSEKREWDWRVRGTNAVVLSWQPKPSGMQLVEQRFVTDPGPVMWSDLQWLTSESVVTQKLKANGYTVGPVMNLLNHCLMPNPPPDCKGPNTTIEFSKGNQQGSATFTPARGLIEVSVSTQGVDNASIDKRHKEIELERGAPASILEYTDISWSSEIAKASLSIRHHRPNESWTMFEQYEPPSRDSAVKPDGSRSDTPASSGSVVPEATIPCQSVRDCWIEPTGQGWKPIARPARLRNKVFKPCKDGERGPACHENACIVVNWKC